AIEERRGGAELAADKRLAEEHVARARRIDRAERNRPLRAQRQAVEPDSLARHHLAALAVPVRFEVFALGARPRLGLDPRRLDQRGAARIEARRLRELGGNDPARRLLRDARAGMQMEREPTRAVVLSRCGTRSRRARADVAEESREERAMQRL